MLMVEAEVYSMDFWREEAFAHENVEFRPIEGYREIREQIRTEKVHLQTGVATVRIPNHITNSEEAIQYAISLLGKYATLLRFALNHDVVFGECVCYELVGGERKQRQKTFLSLRVGKATGGANIYPWGLKEFISIVMPLIQDEKFINETGIYQTLLWYNEAVVFGPNVIEIRFPTLWIALEILANSHAKTNPKVFVLTENEWRELMEQFSEILEKLKISGGKANKLLGAMGNIKSGPIVDKINYFLEECGFPQYCSEIPGLNKLRNDILHGRHLNYNSKPSPIDQMQKLERLLTKLILKVLNFYDRADLIHISIPKDELLARD